MAKITTREELIKWVSYNKDTGNFYTVRSKITRPIGCKTSGYVRLRLNRETYLAHRLAFLYMLGEIPDGIDHIDGNGLNNSWINLRKANQVQNTMNSKVRVDNALGIKGICYVNRKWPYFKASIRSDGKDITKNFSLSTFGSYDEALNAARAWIRENREILHMEYANHG